MISQANPVSSYSDLLREAGAQLGTRKKLLALRTLLLIWPVFIFAAVVLFGEKFFPQGKVPENFADPFWIAFLITGFLAFVYYVFMSFIFEIEKRIWIDSFFDQRNLTSWESWRIARKLFFPTLGASWGILWRYYLPAFLVYAFLLVVFVGNAFFSSDIVQDTIVLTGGAVLIMIYLVVVTMKLRFMWFVFLDRYGREAFSIKTLLMEMRALNAISKGEAFRKALVTELGSSALTVITKQMVRILQSGFGLLGYGGKIFGAFFGIFGKEFTKQAVDLGKIAALYVLYRHARIILHGTSQEVNEYIYNLRK